MTTLYDRCCLGFMLVSSMRDQAQQALLEPLPSALFSDYHHDYPALAFALAGTGSGAGAGAAAGAGGGGLGEDGEGAGSHGDGDDDGDGGGAAAVAAAARGQRDRARVAAYAAALDERLRHRFWFVSRPVRVPSVGQSCSRTARACVCGYRCSRYCGAVLGTTL